MKPTKLIRYRLGVSVIFPKTHPRVGEETYFREKILFALGCPDCETKQDLSGKYISPCNSCWCHAQLTPKIHTIRSNYPFWEKRMKKVQAGEAVIELFHWSGKPYDSNQIVFATLDKDSGCGLQKLGWTIDNSGDNRPILSENCEILSENILARNDGLSLEDFKAWFKSYDLTKPMAIIHFTKFRY